MWPRLRTRRAGFRRRRSRRSGNKRA